MIYLHIPYCHRKCTYCAFYSTPRRGTEGAYVEALCKEMAMRREEAGGVRPKTLYVGGGTPSILSLEELTRIATALKEHYDLGGIEEATIECNPEDLTDSYLEGLTKIGLFNRLSIGLEALDDGRLRRMNRRHNAQEGVAALERAREHGFQNISIDLIYNLPGMDGEEWGKTLEEVGRLIEYYDHLSCYALTVEEGTMLERQIATGREQMPDEEQAAEQYEQLCQWCGTVGLEQYEISNFGKPGKHSQHNSGYWDGTPYIGLGAGAHSYDGKRRRWNVADAAQYIASVAQGDIEHGEERLTAADQLNEYLMTALRTTKGVERHRLSALAERVDATGGEESRIATGMAEYERQGWLRYDGTCYRPTRQGLLRADGMAAALFATTEKE